MPGTLHRKLDVENFGPLNLVQAWWLPLESLVWDDHATQRRMHRRAITAVARGLCSYLAWMNDVRLLVWNAPRVTYALHSGVLIPTLRVLVSFNALAYPEHQVVAVRVNCQSITRFELSGAWQIYSFDLPENALPDAGPTLIELEHVKLLSASEHTNGQCPDQRPLAAAYTWFEFTPR